jgi:aryl-phospho-beta-D-glucosidase BglC (GH1 family)
MDAVPAHVIDPPAVVREAADLRSAGRGGYLLPPGYLSTRGSQIVDSAGRPVRIASIGWNGTEGPPGAAPSGLWRVSYKTVLESIVAAGFNAVRIPWTDIGLDAPLDGYTDRLGWINTSLNPELIAGPEPDAQGRYRYVTTLTALERIVDYAGKIGLKVILDHHGNQGTAGQQRNGLWFDLGPGTNDTDGIVPGKVTVQTFKQNWLTVARAFAGNPTVIGYDLHNEPNGDRGHITWGGGGPTDIKAMCEDVGSAIQEVSPEVLIICEGPEFYKPPPATSGMDPLQAAPAGNLTAAGANPVTLTIPHKLVYSIHEYPDEISDTKRWGLPETGKGFVDRMNATWGFLVRDNIAPVWIGEMGTSLKTPAQREWAKNLLDYMNGKYAKDGGPGFSGAQQPISGSWWLIGPSNDPPYGLQSDWGIGHYRADQLAITDQMLMRPRK